MKYKVRIQDNASGEIRTRDMGDILWHDSALFWWTDGNFGCDCNRRWEFQRAGGEEIDDDPPCSGAANRYRVIDATLEDGTVVEIDGVL